MDRYKIYSKFRIPAGIQKLCDVLFTAEKMSYLIFGALTTLINYAVYWAVAKTFEIDYKVATAVAWLLAVIFAFVTNKFFVFKSRDVKPDVILIEGVLFAAARFVSLLFEMGWMILAVEILKMDDFIAKIIAGVVVIAMNYFFSRLFIFKKKGKEQGKGI
jgi:putative flippase GtrA